MFLLCVFGCSVVDYEGMCEAPRSVCILVRSAYDSEQKALIIDKYVYPDTLNGNVMFLMCLLKCIHLELQIETPQP